MLSCSPAPSTEDVCPNHVSVDGNTPKNDEHCVGNEKDDEDEEGDADFDPFPKGAPSPEASSSLSSEIEGVDSDAVENGVNTRIPLDSTSLSMAVNELRASVGDIGHGEEIVMQTSVSTTGACKMCSDNSLSTGHKKRKVEAVQESNGAEFSGIEDGLSMATHGASDATFKDVSNMSTSKELTTDTVGGDAICMRTRARYSLASFSLDELEAFLQETDDEGDLKNVDDEAEYRKFLAAVLLGGDDSSGAVQENEIVDEDEDNDADFELEIDEALESDVDECIASERRPETRQNKLKKETRQNKRKKSILKKNPSGQMNKQLRPLLPYTPISLLPVIDRRKHTLQTAPIVIPEGKGSSGVFSPYQIGRLHCLIYEHVQLLVQVFCLSVLDPSRQPIAVQIQELILELLRSRNKASASRVLPYPSFCFCPPNMHSSVQDDSPQVPPFVRDPIYSVLDVAPLKLVADFMNDISTAVIEYKQRHLAVNCGKLEKESLFPSQSLHHLGEVDDSSAKRGIEIPKKTTAAALVERTKKDLVAPVPKEIAKLAQRFFPIFNPAIFPHKPPPSPVVNRLLFTDAEDGLLARGLMEYNSDWGKIQEHFLPCKTKHQIFVRQKNRACSKAPENPIKAVRRMKTSPLTDEEKVRIGEGLKIFKYDWLSVWRYIVPYRDPSLLARQYRTAVGIQKSYKKDKEENARRRFNDLLRKKLKDAGLVENRNRRHGQNSQSAEEHVVPVPHCSLPGSEQRDLTERELQNCSASNAILEKKSGDDCVGNQDEAYVHEAFLADWRPGSSAAVSSDVPAENFAKSTTNVSAIDLNHSVQDATTRSPKSNVHPQFYPTRRIGNRQLVKLAPDLLPVNLPPSVRVMSVSAFKKFREEESNKVHGANEGSSVCPIKTGADKGKDPVNCTNKSQPKDKDSSDLQMHPLLFQDPEIVSLPYHSVNASSSSPLNLFPRNHPQTHLSLFNHPQQPKQAVNFLSSSLNTKESTSSVFGIDFHPLMQKSDNSNNDLTASHPSRSPIVLSENLVDGVHTNPTIDSSWKDAHPAPFSPSSSANELDLDIHLCSTSRKEKGKTSRLVKQQTQVKSSLRNQLSGLLSTPHENEIGYKSDLGADAFVLSSSSNVSRDNGNDKGSQALPEIVMEQEELSDSDEEMGDNVEFECEEMADSEGEGESHCNRSDNLQNKDGGDCSLEKTAVNSEKHDQGEPAVSGVPKDTMGGVVEGSSKLNITEIDSDFLATALSLSLNSYDTTFSKPKIPVTRKRKAALLNMSIDSPPQQLDLNAVDVAPLGDTVKGAEDRETPSVIKGSKKLDSSRKPSGRKRAASARKKR